MQKTTRRIFSILTDGRRWRKTPPLCLATDRQGVGGGGTIRLRRNTCLSKATSKSRSPLFAKAGKTLTEQQFAYCSAQRQKYSAETQELLTKNYIVSGLENFARLHGKKSRARRRRQARIAKIRQIGGHTRVVRRVCGRQCAFVLGLENFARCLHGKKSRA